MARYLILSRTTAVGFLFFALLMPALACGQSEISSKLVQRSGEDDRFAMVPPEQSPANSESDGRSPSWEHANQSESAPMGGGLVGNVDALDAGFLTDYFGQLSAEDQAKFSWNLPSGWRITPFGQVRAEMIYAQNPTAADAVRFFFAPDNLDVDDDSFTVNGKTSALSFALAGPEMNGWKTGGAIIINFLGPQPLRNNSGFNVVNAFGFLERDNWKISFGRMVDLFSPIMPSTVNMGQQRAAGNVGIFRGAFNVDRYIENNPNAKWTLSGRVSQNTVSDFLLLPTARGTDNGFPNFEGRIGVELGCECDGQRPVEIGVSGLWGETRAFDPARLDLDQNQFIFLGALQEVSTTAGMNIDMQFRGPRYGVRGEVWKAQAAGTYFAGILQTLNSETGKGIRSIGGWAEVYAKYSPKTTFHTGAGIDDPRNQDVSFITNSINDPGQRTYNSVVWTNVMCDLNKHLQVGFEIAYRKTHYLNPNASSSGFISAFSTALKY